MLTFKVSVEKSKLFIYKNGKEVGQVMLHSTKVADVVDQINNVQEFYNNIMYNVGQVLVGGTTV